MDRIEQQLDLFASCVDPYKLGKDKKVYLVELFAGCGSQYRALKTLLGDRVISWKICDWMFTSIVAYNSINIKDYTDYSTNKTKEEIINRIRGISTNEKEPLSDEQLNKRSLEWIKSAYNNIVATHNLVNIMDAKGSDFELNKCKDGIVIMSYSFPCQDISMAGLMKGYDKDSNTRSSLLWQVGRILHELKELGNLPKMLLLENVPEVCGSKNIKSWKEWLKVLESIGYTNTYSILNAKNYGIPQNRKRCFLVSLLNEEEGSYQFPRKLNRKYNLRHFCKNKVDEKYFLSKKMLEGMINTKFHQYQLKNRLQNLDGCIDTITTVTGERCPHVIAINNNTELGYLLGEVGDGVDTSSRMKYHRGTVQKGLCQTINTKGTDGGVIVYDD